MPVGQHEPTHTRKRDAQSGATPVSAPTDQNHPKASETRARPRAMTFSCSGCETTWTGTQACHCSNCHRQFGGVFFFDRHRSNRGERGACLDPAGLTKDDGAPVMFFRDGAWRGPEMTDSDIRRAGWTA